jgi:hypothetical protein
VVLIAALVAASAVAISTPRPAFATPPQPATDFSYYVRTTNAQTLYNLGYNQGVFDANHGNIDSEVILDFGGQLSNNTGTLLTGTSISVSYATIETLAEQFARGYWYGTGTDLTSQLALSLGTNNSYYMVNTTGGSTWGNVVTTVANWASSNGYTSQINIGGSNDMEPSWNSQSNTISWVQGLNSTIGQHFFRNYGSADGCPQTSHTNGSCNNGWNQYGVWYVSWALGPLFPLPEIYVQAQTNQWVQIDLYGYYYQPYGPMRFVAPLDEYTLDTRTFTSAQAWNSLWNGLSSAGMDATMYKSCEIHVAS